MVFHAEIAGETVQLSPVKNGKNGTSTTVTDERDGYSSDVQIKASRRITYTVGSMVTCAR